MDVRQRPRINLWNINRTRNSEDFKTVDISIKQKQASLSTLLTIYSVLGENKIN